MNNVNISFEEKNSSYSNHYAPRSSAFKFAMNNKSELGGRNTASESKTSEGRRKDEIKVIDS